MALLYCGYEGHSLMINNTQIWSYAFIGGILPSIFWLWFWLREDRKHPEPRGVLSMVFIMGVLAVVFVLPIQGIIESLAYSHQLELVLWAGAEEMVKFIAVVLILYRTKHADEPIDWPIYLITAALGFAALENALFLVEPLSAGNTTVGLITGQLRFLGSTLLHTVTSGVLGIFLGISMHKDSLERFLYFIVGLSSATALHSVFNFFIIRNDGSDFLAVFGFLWVGTIIVMLLFEKVRRMN
jgi:protease PrsW